MKCEKCNDRQANFFYSSTINGQTTQRHLCSECARQEGFGDTLDWNPEAMIDDFWRSWYNPMGMIDGFFTNYRGNALGGVNRAPMMTLPLVDSSISGGQDAAEAERSAKNIPDDAGEAFRSKRELNALRHRLEQAIKAEDFEKAIELRDRIRGFESN